MARPTDWSAVGMQLDPVPGDPAEIRQSASSARSIEQAIAQQVERLKSLKDGEGWESESGEKFRDSAGDLAGAIEKAKGRYTQLAAALDEWANGLEGLQREADAALLQAQDAQDAHRAAANQTITADEDTPEHQDQVDAQDRALSAAQGDIDAAAAIVRRIGGPFGEEGEYGELAGRVADRIRQGADDGLKDGWFDHVKQAIHGARGVLNVIKDALDVVSTLLLPAMIVVGVFFPVAMPALLLVGVAVAALSFAITAAQASAGDASGTDVAWAAAGLAVSAIGGAAGKAALKGMPALTAAVADSGGLRSASVIGQRGGTIAEEAGEYLAGRTTTLRTIDQLQSLKASKFIHETPVIGTAHRIHQVTSVVPSTEAVTSLSRPMMRAAGIQGAADLYGIGDQAKNDFKVADDLQGGWKDYWASKTEIHVGSL